MAGRSTQPLAIMRRSATILAFFIALALSGILATAADKPTNGEGKQPSSFNSALYGGGDGLSKETAVLPKFDSPFKGVPSEYAWIRHHYPGSKPLTQALTARDEAGKRYDIITIQTKDGAEVKLWFDLSSMYK